MAGWQSGAMAESAEQVHARVMAAADENGRVPLPSVASWDIFPWEVVDGELAPKRLAATTTTA